MVLCIGDPQLACGMAVDMVSPTSHILQSKSFVNVAKLSDLLEPVAIFKSNELVPICLSTSHAGLSH